MMRQGGGRIVKIGSTAGTRMAFFGENLSGFDSCAPVISGQWQGGSIGSDRCLGPFWPFGRLVFWPKGLKWPGFAISIVIEIDFFEDKKVRMKYYEDHHRWWSYFDKDSR